MTPAVGVVAASLGSESDLLLDQRGCVARSKFLVGRIVGHRGEYPFAITPEPEHRAQAQADDIGTEVVGQCTGEAQHVVTDVETCDRYGHANAVEQEEHRKLAAHVRAPAMAESPVAIAEVGDNSRNADADNLGADRPIEHRSLPTGKSQVVEQANVDNEGGQANEPKLGHLTVEGSKLIAKTNRSPHYSWPLVG